MTCALAYKTASFQPSAHTRPLEHSAYLSARGDVSVVLAPRRGRRCVAPERAAEGRAAWTGCCTEDPGALKVESFPKGPKTRLLGDPLARFRQPLRGRPGQLRPRPGRLLASSSASITRQSNSSPGARTTPGATSLPVTAWTSRPARQPSRRCRSSTWWRSTTGRRAGPPPGSRSTWPRSWRSDTCGMGWRPRDRSGRRVEYIALRGYS
ncbi:hypothetical protein D9M69_230030 [compost metagenome]